MLRSIASLALVRRFARRAVSILADRFNESCNHTHDREDVMNERDHIRSIHSITSSLSCSEVKSIECVSKRKRRKFEWIFCQIKDEGRRFSGAKSSLSDAEMAKKTPKFSGNF